MADSSEVSPLLAPPTLLRRRITHYTILRLLLATGLFGLVIVLVLSDPSTVLDRWKFFTLVAITYALLGTSLAILPRVKALQKFVIVQMVVDACLITSLVAMTGGAGSIFFVLYFMNIVAGAYLGYGRAAKVTAAVDIALFVLLVVLNVFGVLPYDSSAGPTESYAEVMLRIFGFLLLAVLTARLAEQVRSADTALSRERETSRALAEEYGLIVQSVQSGILVVDREGRIKGANPAAIGCLGECVGRPLKEVLPDAESSERGEILVNGPKGLRNLLFHCAPLGTEGARVVVFDDVTQLRAMEAEIEREERLVGVGRIAAAIAHEIRNPLASLSGAIQLLRDEKPGPLLDIALREVHRLNDLVGDFLEVARPPRIYYRPTNVLDVVNAVCASFSTDPRYSELVKTRVVGGDVGLFMLDPDRLQQILWNLFLNAAQAMPEGGTITVSLSRNETGQLVIDVADEGRGMGPEELEKLFDPFHTTRRGGTGLGLVTVDRIVRAHGGTIEVTSERDRGTRFRILFPERTLQGETPPQGSAPTRGPDA